MMHDDQVDIDIDIARQMIRDQFPQYRHDDVTSVGSSGTVNAIFRIGSKSAARFPLRATKPTECADMLRSEAAAMVEIGQHCLFPTPQPIGLGQPGPRYPMPWAVQTWIEGEVATPNGLSGSAIFALDLASLVASLRQADTRGRRSTGKDVADISPIMTIGWLSALKTARAFSMWLDCAICGPGCGSCPPLSPS